MKLLPPSLSFLVVALLDAPLAHAMDQHQADAICSSWKLECPKGSAAAAGPVKKTGPLECKLKGRPLKEGPSVVCKDGKALNWGEWKAGKKHGMEVTLRPNGSWTEESFADGKQEGHSVEYSRDGQLLKDASFHVGKKHGSERTFSTDGKMLSEEFWNNGVKGKKPAPPAASKPAEASGAAKPKASGKTRAAKGGAPAATESAPPSEEASPPAEAEEAPAPKEETPEEESLQ
jgi:hypothetical protein